MSGLRFKHIYKVYQGGVRAVNDFNLDIKDKSFVVLVGPSGCGKSTTLRMVAGLESITSGQLYIDDVMVNDMESKNRDIAMVFQSYALYPHMTVFQNMGFGLKLRHEKPDVIKEKVLKAAEILEISDLLDRKPKELSGGQRQRVALGRAIVREPNVFLLDEPLSNLDAKLRVQMRIEITKLHEKLQTTFIYVTHDQTEAMTMGDMIVVMNKGFIQQADAPVTLFEDPTNLFVATFLGSPQMNIVNARIVEKGKKMYAELAGVADNLIELREETAKQIRNSNLDLEKEYLFGVRPDHVRISNKGIPAHVEVVEQLGDETIIYTKIEGHPTNFVIKAPLTNTVKSQDDIFVEVDNTRVFLFDKDSEHSLVGMPSFNKLPCKLEGNKITLGNQSLVMDDEFISHLVNRAYEEEIVLAIKPEHVSLTEGEGRFPLEAKVDFVEERTNYDTVFAMLPGVTEYLVFRAPKDKKVAKGNKLTVYFPIENITIFDRNDDALLAREIIFPNNAMAKVSTDEKKNQTIINIVGGQKLVYPKADIADGDYQLTLKQDKCEVVFDKKTAKGMEEEVPLVANKGQFLSVSCYDEEPQHVYNYIYAKINGFPEYVTLVAKNNFSVYKMPKFKINVPLDAIELKPITE